MKEVLKEIFSDGLVKGITIFMVVALLGLIVLGQVFQ